MQDKASEKNRGTSLRKIIFIFLLIGIAAVLAWAASRYWHILKNDQQQLNQQISDLKSKHNEIVDKQVLLEQKHNEIDVVAFGMSGSKPAIELATKNKHIAKLQQLYAQIDNMPSCHSYTKTPVESKQHNSSLINELGTLIRISKRQNSTNPAANLEICKIDLKLMVNDMRWAWLYQDVETYRNEVVKARNLVQRNFDMNNPEVQKAEQILAELGNE